MEKNATTRLLAFIREDECIGCTKCIQACPVDAILGSGKRMHTVISEVCTGCELCVAPCPVDCIDMLVISEKSGDEQIQRANIDRERSHAREQRLAQNTRKQNEDFQKVHQQAQNIEDKKAFIAAAISRAKLKKKLS
jgi:electron transport complex protein RnfB